MCCGVARSARSRCVWCRCFWVYWIVETKEYLKKKTGMDLPSGWWIAVPLYGPIMFLWKWSQAFEKATGVKQMNIFLFMLFIGPYGIWIAQAKFNELEGVNPTRRARRSRVVSAGWRLSAAGWWLSAARWRLSSARWRLSRRPGEAIHRPAVATPPELTCTGPRKSAGCFRFRASPAR